MHPYYDSQFDFYYGIGVKLAADTLGVKEAGLLSFLREFKNKRILEQTKKIMNTPAVDATRNVATQAVRNPGAGNVRKIQRMLQYRRGWRPQYVQ